MNARDRLDRIERRMGLGPVATGPYSPEWKAAHCPPFDYAGFERLFLEFYGQLSAEQRAAFDAGEREP